MSDAPAGFAEVLARARSGDPGAAAALVRQLEPILRRKVRVWRRLYYSTLEHALESDDVCQSVLGNLFIRLGLGQYDLAEPEDLRNLMLEMARRYLKKRAAYHQAACRDIRLRAVLDSRLLYAGSGTPAADSVVAARELLAAVRERLTPEECRLADLRGQGRSWNEVADLLGGNPDARRVQLSRALDRVTRDLGLEESDLE